MRTVLGIPVPKVYSWSSNAQASEVGAEYIMMEKVPGIQVEDVWATFKINDQFEIAKQIIQYQKMDVRYI